MVTMFGAPTKAGTVVLAVVFHLWGGRPRAANESGTLVLIGFTRDGAVLAADSAVVSGDRLVRNTAVKIVPIGHFGAVLISGATRIANGVGEINLYDMISRCATESRDIEAAETCFHDSANASFPKTLRLPTPGRELIIGAYFARYMENRPSFLLLKFLVKQGTNVVSSSSQQVAPSPGFLMGFGRSDFAKAALDGKIPELSPQKELKLFQERSRDGRRADYTIDEMADLEMLLLIQTESLLARRYDPDASGVGPPNHIVVIDRSSGFKEWIPVSHRKRP